MRFGHELASILSGIASWATYVQPMTDATTTTALLTPSFAVPGEAEKPTNRFYEGRTDYRSEARQIVDAAVAEHGKGVIEGMKPVVIGAALDPRIDLDSDEALLEQSVEITAMVNPLFDAVMIASGAERIGERTYGVSLSKKTGNRNDVLRILRALPVVGLIQQKDEVERIHKRGNKLTASNYYHRIESLVQDSSLFSGGAQDNSVREALMAGQEKVAALGGGSYVNHNHFADGQAKYEGLRCFEHSVVSVIEGPEGRMFIKVMTAWSPHRGFTYREREYTDYERGYNEATKQWEQMTVQKTEKVLVPHKGICFYEGAANLHKMKMAAVGDPATVTPAEAVSMVEVAREWGFEIEDGGVVERLAKRLRKLCVVEREPASPGLARLVVGSRVKLDADLKKQVAPLHEIERPAVRVMEVASTEATGIVESVRGSQPGVEVIFDPRVADVIAMADARPVIDARMLDELDDEEMEAVEDFRVRRPGECFLPLNPDQEECVALHKATGIGFCNGSEVGFGKTVVTVQAQRDLARVTPGFRALAVVEANMIPDEWAPHYERWFPEAHVATFTAAQVKSELDAFMDAAGDEPAVLLISREVMAKCVDEIAERSARDGYWHEFVVDEGDFIENTGSKQTKVLWELRPFFRRAVIASGTPVDKSLDSKGRIIAFVRNEPKIFVGNKMSQRFDMAVEEDRIAMHRAMGPVLFRRNTDGPPIDVEVVQLEPNESEIALAEGATTELRRLLQVAIEKEKLARRLPEDDPRRVEVNAELKRVRGAVLGAITLTRQAACDPAALMGSESTGVQLLEAANLIQPAIRDGGTKRAWTCDRVEEWVAAEEPTLIFSDSSSAAVKLRDELKSRGIEAGLFMGGSRKAREAAKAAFNSGETNVLILTAAGRRGHNLPRASVVVMYDLPWVPRWFIQRVGRARRMNSKVEVIKVVVPVMLRTVEVRVAAVLIPRAMKALLALDAHRGVDISQTMMGKAAAALTEVVDEDDQGDEKSLFQMAAEFLDLDYQPAGV